MDCPSVAFVHREPSAQWLRAIREAGYPLLRVTNPASLFQTSRQPPPAVIVLGDPGGGTWAALESARRIRTISATVPLVLIATDSSEATAIAALKIGVNDYLKHPASPEQVLGAVARLLGPHTNQAESTRQLVGDTQLVRALFAYASSVAQTNSTVLITGETGTGKDLLAELIHSMSPRSGKPFIAVNCAAIPDNLLESELFGREKGAYTGADTSYDGKLKLADGGTVLFDEIGDLTPFGQAKLLRVLENRRAQRLGSAKDVPLNIRILAATNRDLAAMVETGQFRRDLYFRLNVTRLELPCLREHSDDIPLLLEHFAAGFETETGRRFPGFSTRAVRMLMNLDWPGNVRQLRNLVEELFVRLPDHRIEVEDLPTEITGRPPLPPLEPLDEKSRIVSALSSTRWNKKRAAERLNWSRMTLYRKMAIHKISAELTAAEQPLSEEPVAVQA
jgi:DNA-binding NtrC family response regulator